MNRDDLKRITRVRLSEARLLLREGYYDGAYYLAGYVLECALKACIAKQTQRYDFPDRKTVNASYTHDLAALLRVAGLDQQLQAASTGNPALEVNWTIAKDWSEESRYTRVTAAEAVDLVSAITNRPNGVLTWLRQHW